eukprot:comp23992_c0_seq1/m.42653 comp23992_c0_seq1/g.42653  ORF comp23992_c0_seq1/g.42653 comp23992_c0_seq1/m.42653 type:complete len:519 (-) comp23992_c0_seq1:578-2134(-)
MVHSLPLRLFLATTLVFSGKAEELVVNGGFEDGLNGWTNAVSASVADGVYREGTSSIALTPQGGLDSEYAAISQVITLPNVTQSPLHLTAYAQMDQLAYDNSANNHVTLTLQLTYADGTTYDNEFGFDFTEPDTWVPLDTKVVPPQPIKAAQVVLMYYAPPDSGSVHFDSVSLVQQPTDVSNPECDCSDWAPKGTCSVTCGGGIISNVRTCTVWGDSTAACATNQTIPCNTNPCPGGPDAPPTPTPPPSAVANCLCGEWSEYGACTVSCGGGTSMRSRTCQTNPAGPCTTTEVLTCNTSSCNGTTSNDTCLCSEWGPPSTCSASCGVGVSVRTRQCPVGLNCRTLDASECHAAQCPNPSANTNTTPDQVKSEESDSGNSKTIAIAVGATVGALVVGVLIGAGVFYVDRRRNAEDIAMERKLASQQGTLGGTGNNGGIATNFNQSMGRLAGAAALKKLDTSMFKDDPNAPLDQRIQDWRVTLMRERPPPSDISAGTPEVPTIICAENGTTPDRDANGRA